MKTDIIKIGNSRGIRLPKSVLDQCHIEKEVNMEIKNDNIILKPINTQPRKNWNKYFVKMSINKDDTLLIPDKIDIDHRDWEW